MRLDFPKILAIDDDVSFCAALDRWLSELGYAMVSADSASAGMQQLARETFAAVLLDLHLPDVSGHALLRQLKRAGLTTPVIVMSGEGAMDDVIRAFRAEAFDYLQKPFRLEELETALRRAEQALQTARPSDLPSDAASDLPSAARGPGSTVAPARTQGVRPAVARIQEELRQGTVQMPRLDPRVLHLQDLVTRENFDLQEVIDTVSGDATLAAAILRVANSVYYARGTTILSLHDACVRIGSKQIVAIALEVIMQDQFSCLHEPYRTVMGQMWRNAQATARVASLLGRMLRRPDNAQLYVAGLLHNIGEMLCLRVCADLASAEGPSLDLALIASELAGLHEDCGVALATAWKLPPALIRIVGYHHRPLQPAEPREHLLLRHVILAAWTLALRAGFTYLPGQESGDPGTHLAALGLPTSQATPIYDEARSWDL